MPGLQEGTRLLLINLDNNYTSPRGTQQDQGNRNERGGGGLREEEARTELL